MNKVIPEQIIERFKTCIIEMGNKMNCYEETGIHYSTIEKIIERKFAKEEQIDKLVSYCESVESLKIKTATC